MRGQTWKRRWSKRGKLMWNFAEHPEVFAARQAASRLVAREEVADKLERAVSTLDEGELALALQQTVALGMDASRYPIVPTAQAYLDRIVETRKHIKLALTTFDLDDLDYALECASSFNWDSEEVQECRSLRERIGNVANEAANAVHTLQPDATAPSPRKR
eukprot:GABV01000685.1.p1 GENE.GABV01000685.1~~GABV01000685.1.p1  ORF type:complete len:161 (-),score=39.77 GABV01000685.1:608-1090(-)